MKKVLATLLLLALVVPISASEDVHLVRFDGGIGVIPVNSAGANTVRGVIPGGQPWVIADLRADIRLDGSIDAAGKGLLLAGGNSIGTTGGASVVATLLCGPLPNGPFTSHSTPVASAVKLEPNGDFRITDLLSPAPPSPCDNPVLLIVNTAGRWFAAGIEKLDMNAE